MPASRNCVAGYALLILAMCGRNPLWANVITIVIAIYILFIDFKGENK